MEIPDRPLSRVSIRIKVLPSTRKVIENFPLILESIGFHVDAVAVVICPPNGAPTDMNRKFSPDQIRDMRGRNEPLKCIAADFGIDMGTVSKIRTGKLYRWVK